MSQQQPESEPESLENEVQDTMGHIINSLDRFESIIAQVSHNIKQRIQNNQRLKEQQESSQQPTLVETHFINDESGETVLRFPLQTIADLEHIEDYRNVLASHLKNQLQECNGSISLTLPHIVSNQLLNELTWEEEEDPQDGRIPLQNFPLFTQLYGKWSTII